MEGVEIPIGFGGINEALNQIKKLQTQGNSAVESIASSFSVLKAVAATALAGVTFKKVVDSAVEGTEALEKLNVALKLSGDFSEQASQDFTDLASSIQRSANVSDEQTLALVAQAKAIGITNSQTEDLVKSSVDIAAVMGTDVNTAFSDLERTLSGKVSRSFAQRFPELKQLSIEALANGEAVRLLGQRYAGAAEDLNRNFGGAVEGIGQGFGEILESIGRVIVQNPAIVEALNRVRSTLFDIADVIGNNVGPAIELTNAVFKTIANTILDLLDRNATFVASVVELATTLRSVLGPIIKDYIIPIIGGYLKAVIELGNQLRDFLGPVLQFVSQGLKVVGVGALTVVRAFNEFQGNTEAVKRLDASIEDLVKSTFEQSTAIEQNTDAVHGQVDAAREYINALVDTEKQESQLTNAKVKASETRAAAIQQEIDKQKLAIAEQQRSIVQSASQSPIGFFSTGANQFSKLGQTEGASAGDVQNAKGQAGVAQAAGALQQALTGPSGAVTLISQVAGTFADTIIPGIGGVVTQITSVLAQGPEATRAFITGFLDAIPVIIENIVESIPVIIDTLVERLPILIEKLAELAPEIAIKLGISLSNQAPFIAQRFTIEFIKNIPNIVKALIDGIVNGIKDAFGSLGGIFGGGGGGGIGGVVSGIGDFFGFADGGTVPGGAPFVDRVPIMATPGEEILNKSLSQKLEDALNSGQLGGGDTTIQVTVPVQIGEEQFATVYRTVKRKGYRLES